MSVLGLDIGSKSIKLVQLSREGDSWRLVAAGVTATPASLDAGDAEAAIIAQAVKKLVADTKATSTKVNLSLAENKVFTRFVRLPYLTDQEVDAAISWQAEPNIPIPVESASIDHQVIGRIAPSANKPGSTEVLLIAAPKALVGKYVKIAQLAGLETQRVETGMLALSRSVAPPSGTVVIVDVGGTYSSIAVVRNGQLILTHFTTGGGDVFTKAVATGLGVSVAQAEEYKKAYGLSAGQVEGKVTGALLPVLGALSDEIKKTIQFYKTETADESLPAATILSGGVAGLPEIASFLAKSLKMEVVIGDPLAALAKDENITKSLGGYAPLYGIAIGLAME